MTLVTVEVGKSTKIVMGLQNSFDFRNRGPGAIADSFFHRLMAIIMPVW